jgi:hypothetical protein
LLKRRRCALHVKHAQQSRQVGPGANLVSLTTRAGRLGPGSYRTLLTVTDAPQNTSRERVVTFRVLAGRRKS